MGLKVEVHHHEVATGGQCEIGVGAGGLVKKADEVQILKYAVLNVAHGYGKKTPMSEYKVQGRGGSGIKTADVTAKTGEIIGAKVLVGEEANEEEIVIISKKGQVIRTSTAEIPSLSRATQGVRIMKMREGDSIASMVAL